jgi:hypothetical protein
MIDEETRAAILLLHSKNHGKNKIAKSLGISSSTVRAVVRSGKAQVPAIERTTPLDGLSERVTELHGECKGNLVRVHENLLAEVPGLAYTTLTGYCRRHGIGKKVKVPAGTHDYGPGVEMQHDTSPHRVLLGAHMVLLQCATLVLAHSRMIYGQVYERWTRLTARGFLTAAIQFFGGAAARCIIDNSNVVLLHGTGHNAVVTAEMTAFGKRFGVTFLAHGLMKPNRKGKVERPFHFVEHNFYPGRTFADLADCNRQFLEWCDKQNGSRKRHLQARPIDLFAVERVHLKPLPVHLPAIFHAESRLVDLEGWVRLHTNRYSAPADLIRERVEVREYMDKVCLYDGARLIATHPLLRFGARDKSRLPEHEVDRTPTRRERQKLPIPEEQRLRTANPAFGSYIDGLKTRHVGRGAHALRRLLRMWQELPEESVLAAVRQAQHYGMYDMSRLETMVLKRVAGDFFQLPLPLERAPNDDGDPHES